MIFMAATGDFHPPPPVKGLSLRPLHAQARYSQGGSYVLRYCSEEHLGVPRSNTVVHSYHLGSTEPAHSSAGHRHPEYHPIENGLEASLQTVLPSNSIVTAWARAPPVAAATFRSLKPPSRVGTWRTMTTVLAGTNTNGRAAGRGLGNDPEATTGHQYGESQAIVA
jgi:hypothetical protein